MTAARLAPARIPAATRARRGANQEANAWLPRLCELQALAGAHRGRPCIIAGAGPSFWKAWPMVKAAHAAEVPIVAVDRIFPAMHDRGVIPRVVVTLDDGDEVQDFFRGRDLSRTICIANTTANAGAVKMFKSRVFYRVARERSGGQVEPYPREVELWPKTATLSLTAGYVGGEAAMVADHLGGRPLIFVGYDLHPNPGLAALHVYMSQIWAPLARRKDPNLRIWNASPGSVWTAGCETVTPETVAARLGLTIPPRPTV